MPKAPEVITRFAPSPTGHLHIGGARTALFCWAFAKHYGGHFLLRIEDTDAARSSDESARGIMEDLAWLGIEWDEGPELQVAGRAIGGDPRGVGPFFQARRVPLYNSSIMKLVEQGKAYPAFESSEELEAKRRAAVAAKQTYRYDRAALQQMPEIKDRLKRMQSGEPHVVRFFAPHEEVVVHDQVLGDVRYAPGEMDDFVIRKADGFPTYHFAVVIDDETMGITHVLRAQEHLNNTPRHVALQKALGFRRPVYAHMPLIINMDGSKMSKRDKAKAARKALKDALAKSGGAPQSGPGGSALPTTPPRGAGVPPASPSSTSPSPSPPLSIASIASTLRLDPKQLEDFLSAENDSLDIATTVAKHFAVPLPEIEVHDFRTAGYTPGAITNFIALMGWNPGLKTPDGKDLEKFDRPFLAQHFSLERIGTGNARFDRAKLLSFNADAIGAMSDRDFTQAWRAWCVEHEPALAQKLDDRRLAILARVIKPRAKTMRDGVKSAAWLLLDDHAVPYDAAAAEKGLLASDKAGLKLLAEFRARVAALSAFDPEPIHAAMESLAKEKGFVTDKGVNVGPIAQPVRIAIAGTPVTPPLGETLAVLGKDSTLVRFDRCLKYFG